MTAQSKHSYLLQGRKIVIISGISGLGFALASALVEEDAKIVVSSVKNERVDAAVKSLTIIKSQYNADPKRVQGKEVNLSGRDSEVNFRLRRKLFDGKSIKV